MGNEMSALPRRASKGSAPQSAVAFPVNRNLGGLLGAEPEFLAVQGRFGREQRILQLDDDALIQPGALDDGRVVLLKQLLE